MNHRLVCSFTAAIAVSNFSLAFLEAKQPSSLCKQFGPDNYEDNTGAKVVTSHQQPLHQKKHTAQNHQTDESQNKRESRQNHQKSDAPSEYANESTIPIPSSHQLLRARRRQAKLEAARSSQQPLHQDQKHQALQAASSSHDAGADQFLMNEAPHSCSDDENDEFVTSDNNQKHVIQKQTYNSTYNVHDVLVDSLQKETSSQLQEKESQDRNKGTNQPDLTTCDTPLNSENIVLTSTRVISEASAKPNNSSTENMVQSTPLPQNSLRSDIQMETFVEHSQPTVNGIQQWQGIRGNSSRRTEWSSEIERTYLDILQGKQPW